MTADRTRTCWDIYCGAGGSPRAGMRKALAHAGLREASDG